MRDLATGAHGIERVQGCLGDEAGERAADDLFLHRQVLLEVTCELALLPMCDTAQLSTVHRRGANS